MARGIPCCQVIGPEPLWVANCEVVSERGMPAQPSATPFSRRSNQAAVQRSLVRLGNTPAYDATRRRVSVSAVEELFAHALPFVAPARLGAPTRGVPTAWAAPPLADAFAGPDELPPVWPSPLGTVRGLAVQPLHAAALELAAHDPWLYEMLALVDGVRVGDARVRGLALERLLPRLGAGAQA